ncbi:O-methyltransferase [Alicyclobacillus vulcanalis]|uniref:Caffeoyl-CoA O-methyltransferase n=1 Tax=Alicyclobacillus vulcanalis TaxID=252246 RepID=A0A1N7NZQ7_9BACL|nr:O-methyltransferase [Alicyclobacillus vulcanalis]SIT03756.1 caffeoyl-CoA O-methyltransferase [Alicyclobacillus vulcanalis]
MTSDLHELPIEAALPGDPIRAAIRQSLSERGWPDMCVPQALGQFLTQLAMSASAALEIGTYAGYSAICIARGLPSGARLVTLESRPEHAQLAEHHIAAAGFGHCVEVVLGDAADTLLRLRREGQRFDLAFIDAHKPSYPRYLDLALELMRPGGFLVFDNAFGRNRVFDPSATSPTPVALRELHRKLFAEPRLVSTLLPMFDGVAVARVRP